MKKLNAPEEFQMLRHRFARTIEIWVAYNTFLNREVHIGHDKTCLNETIVFQTTHTLLISYYSFIYSLFDPSAVNFQKITESMLTHLDDDAREARDIAVSQWEQIKIPMSIIRNNIGFHQSSKEKGSSRGYEEYGSIHPYATELIMNSLRVFFRKADAMFESSEQYGKKHAEADTADLMNLVRNLRQYIADHPGEEVFKSIYSIFNNL